MKLSHIFTIIIFLLFFWWTFYLSWITWILQSILSLIFYCFITFWIYSIWKNIRKKETLDFTNYIIFFLYKAASFFILIGIIIWGFCYYYNEKSPAAMPQYTLNNWEKTVVFQAMSHIWSNDFYTKIKNDLENRKQEWYVYYYEWVKPWTDKNMKNFNSALWIEFDPDLYKNFSKLYWVIHQDNSIFMNLVNDKDFNVDISIDEIMDFYTSTDSWSWSLDWNSLASKEVLDINSEIVKTLSLLNDRQLSLLQYINQALLNFIIWNTQTQSFIQDNFSNKQLFDVILGKRDNHLASEVHTSSHDKIFITYGLLHFEWFFWLLKQKDPNWKIIETTYSYPIK